MRVRADNTDHDREKSSRNGAGVNLVGDGFLRREVMNAESAHWLDDTGGATCDRRRSVAASPALEPGEI